MTRVAMVVTRIRTEEKLLLAAFEDRGVQPELVLDEELVLNPAALDPFWRQFDVVLARNLSTTRGLYLLQQLDVWGLPAVNRWPVAATCADKFSTALALARAGVPQPEARLTFAPTSTLNSLEQLGYPAVLKPPIGSWGRLLARVRDVDAAEAVLEHRHTLGSYMHHAHFVQDYVEKPEGRDIRAFVIDGEAVCAIYRISSHWVTNTARGGRAENCPLSEELLTLCRQASEAVGGGALAMDLFETEEGLLVNEINHTMEFRNSIEPTGVDIAAELVEYVLQVAKGQAPTQGEPI